MRRRELLGLFGAAAMAKPSAARDIPVAGFLSSLSHSVKFETAFRRGLAETGYVDGQNVIIEYRWLEAGYDALPQMAADLVQRQAAVIAAFGPPAVVAAKAAAPSVPIVFITGADPVKFGFVASFNRPGGNLTG